jgi:hypothetical protein
MQVARQYDENRCELGEYLGNDMGMLPGFTCTPNYTTIYDWVWVDDPAFDAGKSTFHQFESYGMEGWRPGYYDEFRDKWIYPDGRTASFSVFMGEMTVLVWWFNTPDSAGNNNTAPVASGATETPQASKNIFTMAIQSTFKPPENSYLRLLWRVQNPMNEVIDAIVNPHTVTVGSGLTFYFVPGIDSSMGGYVSWDLFGSKKFDYGSYATVSYGIGIDISLGVQLGYYDTTDIRGRSLSITGGVEPFDVSYVWDEKGNIIGRVGGLSQSPMLYSGHISLIQYTGQFSAINPD